MPPSVSILLRIAATVAGGEWPAIYSDADEFPVAFGVAQVPETWIVDPSGVVQVRIIARVSVDTLNVTMQQLREAYG